MKIDWKYVILFILLSLGIAYFIHQGFLLSTFHARAKDSFLSESSYLIAGLSTLVAAIIGFLFHKDLSKRITIFGKDKIKNILILCLPVVAFSIIGLDNNYGIHKSLYGFAFASINLLYAFTEEIGWRRYLQNALQSMNPHLKYVFIGVIWWIWHFRFETQFDLFSFPLICIGGGYLLGKLADDTKSILPVVAMHTLIILTTNSGNVDQNKLIGIGLVIIGWVVIEQIWKRKKVKPLNG